MSGVFITFEGIEGVGKSTNVEFALHHIRTAGIDVLLTREPGGTELGEKIRHWILNEDHGGPLGAQVEALLMFAARAHHLDRVIRPALAAGRWVLCDRFTDATIAYQGYGRRSDMGLLESLRAQIHGDLEPHLTVLLDAPVSVGFERIGAREHDHFEREQREFFERVRAGYLALAERYPERIKIVDAAQPLPQVQRDIAALLEPFTSTHR